MSHEKKFDPKMLDKLKNPERLERENPEIIWKLLALENPDCIIDIGAGVGFTAIPFAKKLESGTVWACDISEEMLAELHKEIGINGPDLKVKPLLTGEVDVPLPASIADAVIMLNLHHEFDSAHKNMLEAKRLLKTGGKVAIIDWKKEETPAGPPLDIRVTFEEINKDLTAAGFTAIEQHTALPFHTFVVGIKGED
jgi:ubiquinone/menaquinone biosynthesis C-methylase UbiE